jgi:cytochrome b6
MSAGDPSQSPQTSAGWLAERLGWARIEARLGRYTVSRRGFVFHLGGIALFLFLVQVVSGILLMLYYQPDPALARSSIERITGEIAYGDLVHAMHVWSGDLFVATLLLHLFSVAVRGTFRSPNELSWLSGIALLLLGVGQAFTGAVLPWTERAYTHARVGSEFARYVPLVGDWLHRFMRGGDDVTATTLSHAFGFHVALLPAAVTTVVAMHLFLLTRRPAPAPAPPTEDSLPVYPDFFVRQAVALTGVMVVLLTLAIFVERPLGPPADPRLPSPPGALPPWYFLPIHAIVRAAPKELLGIEGPRFLVGAACVVGLVLLALPFIDRRGSRVTAWLAWIVMLTLLLLSFRALT